MENNTQTNRSHTELCVSLYLALTEYAPAWNTVMFENGSDPFSVNQFAEYVQDLREKNEGTLPENLPETSVVKPNQHFLAYTFSKQKELEDANPDKNRYSVLLNKINRLFTLGQMHEEAILTFARIFDQLRIGYNTSSNEPVSLFVQYFIDGRDAIKEEPELASKVREYESTLIAERRKKKYGENINTAFNALFAPDGQSSPGGQNFPDGQNFPTIQSPRTAENSPDQTDSANTTDSAAKENEEKEGKFLSESQSSFEDSFKTEGPRADQSDQKTEEPQKRREPAAFDAAESIDKNKKKAFSMTGSKAGLPRNASLGLEEETINQVNSSKKIIHLQNLPGAKIQKRNRLYKNQDNRRKLVDRPAFNRLKSEEKTKEETQEAQVDPQVEVNQQFIQNQEAERINRRGKKKKKGYLGKIATYVGGSVAIGLSSITILS